MTASCTNLNFENYEETRDAVADDPEAAQGTFESVTRWTDAARAVTEARSFTIETDEPEPLGGTDQAIDPMELLLGALGSCVTIGWVTQANEHGIDYEDLTVRVKGHYDLRGYLDVEDDVRPGFEKVEYTVEVETDASDELLAEIRETVERTSPMFDNIANGVTIEGDVET